MGKDITSNAIVNISVNGNDAEQTLDNLRRRVQSVKDQITALEAAGTKKNDPQLRKLRQEYQDLSRELRRCQTEMSQVDSVMRRLNTAAPNELRNAIKQLQRELNTLHRGSEAWNRHTANIRRLQQALNEVNDELRVSQTRWQRFHNWMNGAQTAIMGAAAALTGLIQAGRMAVKEFLEMDQEMANVRKYTGMSSEQVDSLNEKMKQIDTRTGRVELNKLAQEAGRLGKNSEEDVLGFVNAAQKINVALDDLGDGATLKLSKLTGIFGDEKRLGTEKALLSVGSVINELSQNCSASAPYLAQFASRMGGVAAQAGMTIQQVMAFGAVLDTTNQGVEASSTAVSQVITRLYQDTAKYAKVAKLDVKEFSDLLKRDANEAFLTFLTALNKAGGLDVLSPMFKDMGENGARAIAALSSLASHIDEVRWQQGEANKAFEEAVSIDKEFEVQNTTLLAQQEKAKKQFQELAIELGEKLQPILRHIYSSTSLMMKALSAIVTFIINHRGAIVALTLAIASYHATVLIATVRTKTFGLAAKAAALGMNVLKAAVLVTQAAFFGLIGRVDKATAALRLLGRVIKLNPVGLLVTAITALGVALYNVIGKTDEFTKKLEAVINKSYRWQKETFKEREELAKLIGKLKGAKEGTEEYMSAKDALLSKYDRYLEGLVTEEGKILDLEAAYDRLTKAIQRNSMMRQVQEVEDELNERYLKNVTQNLNVLQESLEHFGMEPMDASEIVTAVSRNILSGDEIPEALIEKINEFSAKRVGGKNAWEKVSSWFNNSKLSATAQDVANSLGIDWRVTDMTPATAFNKLQNLKVSRDSDLRMIDNTRDGIEPMRGVETRLLQLAVDGMRKAIEAEKDNERKEGDGYQNRHNVTVMKVTGDNLVEMTEVTLADAKVLLKKYEEELGLRGSRMNGGKKTVEENPFGTGVESETMTEKERKKAEREAKAARLKASREFKRGLAAIRAEMEAEDAAITRSFGKGEITYLEMLERRMANEKRYYDRSRAYYENHFAAIHDYELKEDKDYQKLLSDREAMELKYSDKILAYKDKQIQEEAKKEENRVRMAYVKRSAVSISEELSLEAQIREVKARALEERRKLYAEGSEDWWKLTLEIEENYSDGISERSRRLSEEAERIKESYEKLSLRSKYSLEKEVLDVLLQEGRITFDKYLEYLNEVRRKLGEELPGANFERTPEEKKQARKKEKERKYAEVDRGVEEGQISEDEAKRRKFQIDKEEMEGFREAIKNCGSEWVSLLSEVGFAWADLWESIGNGTGDVLDDIAKAAEATFAVVSAGMQMAADFTKAKAEIEIKAVEKRYDRESELAQGNTYMTKKLEQEKQEKIAEIKNKASKANFRMMIIQATAQTIMGAINAYTSTEAIPVIGPELAPIAAAVATAAGIAQIALLTKQQQAADSTGYSEGGYTKPGRKNEVAGVVHAGEWVASQELLDNPKAAQIIEKLDAAQRSGDMSLVDGVSEVTEIRMSGDGYSGDSFAGDAFSAESFSMPLLQRIEQNQPLVRSSLIEKTAEIMKNDYPVSSITPETVSYILGTGAASTVARQTARTISSGVDLSDGVGAGLIEINGSSGNEKMKVDLAELKDVISLLTQRLEKPFVTINTVTGKYGMDAAIEEHERMIRNKNRRK